MVIIFIAFMPQVGDGASEDLKTTIMSDLEWLRTMSEDGVANIKVLDFENPRP
jgi:hypothetical protein